jgi:hypothetical protein
LFYISQVGRYVREEPKKAFGGLQLIVCGDFGQLNYVDTENRISQHMADNFYWKRQMRAILLDMGICAAVNPILDLIDSYSWNFFPPEKKAELYAFATPTWKQCRFTTIYLQTQRRQAQDLEFAAILQRVRNGLMTKDDHSYFIQRDLQKLNPNYEKYGIFMNSDGFVVRIAHAYGFIPTKLCFVCAGTHTLCASQGCDDG